MSTPGSVQYSGGYHEYSGGFQYTGGHHEYAGGYHDEYGGYHQYTGGCLVHTNSIVFPRPSPTFIMISRRCTHDIAQCIEHFPVYS